MHKMCCSAWTPKPCGKVIVISAEGLYSCRFLNRKFVLHLYVRMPAMHTWGHLNMSRSDPVVCQPQSSSDTYAPLPSSEGTRPPLPCSRTELYFCFHLKELNSKSLVLKSNWEWKYIRIILKDKSIYLTCWTTRFFFLFLVAIYLYRCVGVPT